MGTVYVDTSILNEVASCEKAAYLRYVCHRTRRSEAEAPLICGSALHKVEEARQLGATPAEGMAILEAEYREWAEQEIREETDVRSWANVAEITQIWLESYPVTEQTYETVPGSVEAGVACALDEHGDVVLVGKLDKLVMMHGAVMVSDFKHTAMNLNGKNRERWAGWYEMAAQGPGYVTMAGQTLGQPVVGMQWSVLSLASLPNSTATCKQHKLPYRECRRAHVGFVQVGPRVYGAAELTNWRLTAVQLAKTWLRVRELEPKAVAETGRYSGQCERCQFREFCKAGSPWDQLGAMAYVEERWEPYQHAFGGPTREVPVVASVTGPTSA